jgi:hypothetical protein
MGSDEVISVSRGQAKSPWTRGSGTPMLRVYTDSNTINEITANKSAIRTIVSITFALVRLTASTLYLFPIPLRLLPSLCKFQGRRALRFRACLLVELSPRHPYWQTSEFPNANIYFRSTLIILIPRRPGYFVRLANDDPPGPGRPIPDDGINERTVPHSTSIGLAQELFIRACQYGDYVERPTTRPPKRNYLPS